VSLQLLDDAERRAYLQRATGRETDPFAAPAGAAPRFLTFVLLLEHTGEGRLVLEAQNCWLRGEGGLVLYPVGAEAAQAAYGVEGLEPAPAYAPALRAVLERSVVLEPGETVAGLLVYPSPKPRTKRFHVEVQLTTSSGDVVRMHAPYRLPKRGGDGR
jgi:hypothetical protein